MLSDLVGNKKNPGDHLFELLFIRPKNSAVLEKKMFLSLFYFPVLRPFQAFSVISRQINR